MTLVNPDITSPHEPFKSSNSELVDELEAMMRPGLAVAERKEVAIPNNLNPDPNMLVGYMRNITFDPDSGKGAVSIIEGHAQHHGRVLQAEELAEGLPSPASYDEPIVMGERKINGQVRFAIDSTTNAVTFQVHAADPFDGDIQELVKTTYKTWVAQHQTELLSLPQTGTQNIQYDYFPIVPGEKATTSKWLLDKAKLWRDGQLDEEYIDSVF
jgi:hypothetical protein